MDGKRRFDGGQPPLPSKKVQRAPRRSALEEEEDAAATAAPEFTPEDDDEELFLDHLRLKEAQTTTELLGIEGVESKLKSWERDPLPPIDPSTDPITFQQLDLDYFVGKSPTDSRKPVPIIRIFGVTENGNSACIFVHGFEPYFYVKAPTYCNPDDVLEFQRCLESATKDHSRQKEYSQCVTRVEVVKSQSLMHFHENKDVNFFKIFLALPSMVPACRGILEKGFSWGSYSHQHYITYESNVLFSLRFMIDHNISGGNWIEIPPRKYSVVKEEEKISLCQLEVQVHHQNIISHEAEGKWSKIAPFRILSFDIECAGRKGHFPEPEIDPVIQIANLVTVQGEDKPRIRNVLTLNSCAPIVGCDVFSFEEEKQVLIAWRDLIQHVDPDIIIGYNIIKFDLPYLIQRAEKLDLNTFPLLGRLRGVHLRMKDSFFSSRQYGTRESKEITIEGRIQFDLMQAIQRDYKLSSYSLNSVSSHFLNEQKEEVHYSIISDLQQGQSATAETRRRLAVYCLKDAYLPQRLLDKLMYVYNYIEMARVTGVPFSFLLSRGQSIKVFSQLLRKSRQRNLLVPNLKVQGNMNESYEGATVLDAKQGYYDKPIATLDFASLYPSIMISNNLCYCTLVPKDMLASLKISQENLSRSPTGDIFVKPSLMRGILPEILEELIAARKRAKADLKASTDPFQKAVLDGRQLALKISANSVYGFTGASVGALPCLEISSSVTGYGREMIEHTKKLVEKEFTINNGYEHDAEVIYGDTDSVMVSFGVDNVEEGMKLGKIAAEKITETFPKPIKLEFEKVYFPYLLISKKRYAGLLWTKPETYDKMDTKGIETVRRDNCLLVKNIITECLKKILIDRNIDGAVNYAKKTISDLLMNKIDLSLLVITKGLSKVGEDYAVKAAHVELAERMRKRDPANAPGIGDRIPYVIIKAAKGAKAYEKSEDPIHVLENNIPIDPQYYLENQLSKPLLRIFEPIMKNASRELLHGEHTRNVSISTPSSVGIMKFAKVKLSCLSCKTPLNGESRTLCNHCKPKEVEIYQKMIVNARETEELFNKLWTQCQRCQGSFHQDVLCTSRDCPIFYRRKKIQKDVDEASSQLARFEF